MIPAESFQQEEGRDPPPPESIHHLTLETMKGYNPLFATPTLTAHEIEHLHAKP